MSNPFSPKVFVSYAHDSEDHKRDVLTLAALLMKCGVDVELDQWVVGRRQDWSAWAIQHMIQSDYVLVVASPHYRRVGDGQLLTGVNRGVQSETAVLRDLLHSDRATWLPKLLPVVLPGRNIDEIPVFLQPYSADHYQITKLTMSGIEDLLRTITQQPSQIRPPLGKVPVLEPQPSPVEEPAVRWHLLDYPLPISWRSDLVTSPGPFQPPALEVHLVPPNRQRVSARQLATFADDLVDLGRQRRLFTKVERLTANAGDDVALAFSDSGGIAVHRTGQRSAWTDLPRGRIGSLLIQQDVVERLVTLLNTLLEIDLPHPERLAPAAGLEPLDMVRIGSEADLHSSSATVHMTHPERIRVEPEEALTYDDLTASVIDVAEELATRLIARFKKECR